ncbi:MAG: hypothetical protein ABI183_17680 [Polyangiaceae bacterium]
MLRSASSPLLAVLASIAALPFALVCCKGVRSDAPTVATTPSVDTGTRLIPSPDQSPSPLVSASAIADAAPSNATATASVIVPLGPKAKCEEARRSFGAVVARSRGCKEDADCTQMFTACGLSGVCGMSVAKNAESKIKAAEKSFDDAKCMVVLAAPCPTCAMPPPPKCVAGKCS